MNRICELETAKALFRQLQATWPRNAESMLLPELVTPTPKDPHHRADADAHLLSDPFDGESRLPKPDYCITIEDPAWATDWVPRLGAVFLCSLHSRAHPLVDQFPFELCDGCENMQEQLAGGIGRKRIPRLDNS
jgi:hypothetical protein